jgi:hypothetical protein
LEKEEMEEEVKKGEGEGRKEGRERRQSVHMISFYHNYLCKVTMSKYRHILRY